MIPKADLHVHLEGTIPPRLVRQIAKRNQITVPDHIFGPHETYRWRDFLDFLRVYDIASSVIRTPQDYYDITYDYLTQSARQGTIYCELMASPDHAALSGLSYSDMLHGVVQAIDDAYHASGIVARIIIVCVRHFGIAQCIHTARSVVSYPHPYVVGFGMGGDEINYPAKDFQPAFAIAHDAGLQCTVHAGEMQGADSVWQAINFLPVKRIGHGVRAIEDTQLLTVLHEREIGLEVCPGSNICLGVYRDFQHHPFNRLRAAGIRLALGSDDPPYFATSLAQEYHNLQHHFGLTETEVRAVTRSAIAMSFADAATQQRLREKI